MRTERVGSGLSGGVGVANGTVDDTLDKWTDVQCYVYRDGVVELHFTRLDSQHRVIDTYECVMDDERVMIDLAIDLMQAVARIQQTEDLQARSKERTDSVTTALDGPAEVARKQAQREALDYSHRRVVARRVKPTRQRG